jgi:signal transduction histidine kinase
VVLLVFFGLVFLNSLLAVAIVSGALGVGHHRGLAALSAIVGLALLFGGAAVVGRVIRRTAVPLEDVMEAADRVAAGDYSARVDAARGFPQMRRLAGSFNAMTDRLRTGEEHRRNLLADVTHELRTPLSVIQGGVEGILDGLYPADREHLEPILEETRIMARLLDDLQTLSTAQAGVLRLHLQTCRPDDLAEEAVAAFRAAAASKGVTLGARAEPDLPSVQADPVRIGEVLSNLVSNALRHTPAGGSVQVVVSRSGTDGVAFEVVDTGRGIDPALLPHVFDRFVKSSDSGGAGLGLAIARSLVEAHGGAIAATSDGENGSTIRFVLPT